MLLNDESAADVLPNPSGATQVLSPGVQWFYEGVEAEVSGGRPSDLMVGCEWKPVRAG